MFMVVSDAEVGSQAAFLQYSYYTRRQEKSIKKYSFFAFFQAVCGRFL
jgi:hypothetical protein